MAALLLAAGCGGVGGDVDTLDGSPRARADVPAARTGWAWVDLWRKVAEGERGLFSAIVSSDAEFLIHEYDSGATSGEMARRPVSRRAWLAEARRIYSSDDRDVHIRAAGDSGPVAEIRGWDATGKWKYSISAVLKAEDDGGLVAVKLGLFK